MLRIGVLVVLACGLGMGGVEGGAETYTFSFVWGNSGTEYGKAVWDVSTPVQPVDGAFGTFSGEETFPPPYAETFPVGVTFYLETGADPFSVYLHAGHDETTSVFETAAFPIYNGTGFVPGTYVSPSGYEDFEVGGGDEMTAGDTLTITADGASTATPEPETVALVGTGLLAGVMAAQRRLRRPGERGVTVG